MLQTVSLERHGSRLHSIKHLYISSHRIFSNSTYTQRQRKGHLQETTKCPCHRANVKIKILKRITYFLLHISKRHMPEAEMKEMLDRADKVRTKIQWKNRFKRRKKMLSYWCRKKFEMAEKKIGKNWIRIKYFTNKIWYVWPTDFQIEIGITTTLSVSAGLNKTVNLNDLLWQLMFMGSLSRFHTVESIFVTID